MTAFNRRLRSILVEYHLLDEEVAEKLLAESVADGTSLEEVAVKSGRVDQKALIGAIASEMNMPPIEPLRVEPDAEALAVLPQDVAEYYGVLPIAKIGNTLTVAVSNPFDIIKLDDVETVTGHQLRPVVASGRAIREAIMRAYSAGEQEMEEIIDNVSDLGLEFAQQEEEQGEDLSAIIEGSADSPVVKLVNLIIYQGLRDGASDVHIEPYEKKLRVRYRLDGMLRDALSPPKRLQNAIVSRIKIMADLDIAERRVPQDGKFQMRFEGRQVDFRVSILPIIHGEKVVMRILDTSNLSLELDQLGFEEQGLNHFRNAISSPYGMILVTGPTGSGKTTTLYAAIRAISDVSVNIVTVEDPVEYQMQGVNQVAVNEKRGLTFAGALRSFLRQDPDIILVGEIRDTETAEIAIKAALTGHMVLSTLHTNNAPSTVTRLVDMGVDPFLVASSTVLVSAQRLCRKLCDECKETVEVSEETLVDAGARPEDIEGATFFKAVGCRRCTGGHRGRFALLETMPMSEEVRRIVVGHGSSLDVASQALKEGMLTLRRCAIRNAARGRTSLKEALRVTMID